MALALRFERKLRWKIPKYLENTGNRPVDRFEKRKKYLELPGIVKIRIWYYATLVQGLPGAPFPAWFGECNAPEVSKVACRLLVRMAQQWRRRLSPTARSLQPSPAWQHGQAPLLPNSYAQRGDVMRRTPTRPRCSSATT